jgi:membrane fusion protein (multidrug efflux system)
MFSRPQAFLCSVLWLLVAAAAPVLANQGPLVEVVQAEKTLVRDELITFGSLRSDESVMIRPEIPGRLAALHFREGQSVEAGALLISLDDAIARAELAQAQANLSLAEKSHQRAQMLFKRGASNAQALDEASAQQQAAPRSLLAVPLPHSTQQVRPPFRAETPRTTWSVRARRPQRVHRRHRPQDRSTWRRSGRVLHRERRCVRARRSP